MPRRYVQGKPSLFGVSPSAVALDRAFRPQVAEKPRFLAHSAYFLGTEPPKQPFGDVFKRLFYGILHN